jgi:hypothetical protein
MCFPIKSDAKPWQVRTVYKVLYLPDWGRAEGVLCSPFELTYDWAPGVHDIGAAQTRDLTMNCARAGFYVLKSRAAAQRFLRANFRRRTHVIVSLKVRPRDFLFASVYDPDVATYSRVEMPERQREVEFE